jgi:hypothetical protein
MESLAKNIEFLSVRSWIFQYRFAIPVLSTEKTAASS